ncbi:transposase [Geobacter argillaceus]|uniref:REP element-mobilizing transposase RayT n=1 Tax=Geobacter argillaceus TaxID=345631 RepID=A0A562WRK2_9BACT|nr:transposase [Geobacter argillaceus]TWJ32741.1 REP element-mobilizing transposase RayT [Geobacter argillaceus]
MGYVPGIHHRRSIRLRDYDYAAAGAYFVTVCAQGRECLFGGIVDGAIVLNDAGRMVAEWWWRKVPEHFPEVTLDVFTVMPNHFHGLIFIDNVVGAGFPRPVLNMAITRRATLGQVVGYFKYQTTKQVNQMRDNPGVPVWQRNYYERIVRNDAELAAIREYIATNPQQWADDEENPEHPSSTG